MDGNVKLLAVALIILMMIGGGAILVAGYGDGDFWRGFHKITNGGQEPPRDHRNFQCTVSVTNLVGFDPSFAEQPRCIFGQPTDKYSCDNLLPFSFSDQVSVRALADAVVVDQATLTVNENLPFIDVKSANLEGCIKTSTTRLTIQVLKQNGQVAVGPLGRVEATINVG